MQQRISVIVAAAWSVAGLIGPAWGEAWPEEEVIEAPLLSEGVAIDVDSGRIDLARSGFARSVHVPGATSMRLHFGACELPSGSWIRVLNPRDGEEQVLDATALREWRSSTAYFNTDTLVVRLEGSAKSALRSRKARGLVARVSLASAEVPSSFTPRGGPGACGICGEDDRTPSQFSWAGRLMPNGCSASVVCADSTILTAGHCAGNNVIHFNVPPSTSGCSAVNPPVADQFPLTMLASGATSGGDWAVMRGGLNSLGQRPFDRYGAMVPIAPQSPAAGDQSLVVGYGWDQTCERAMTQQLSPGQLVQVSEMTTRFDNDVRSVSSGSPLMVDGEVVAVVTTCALCSNGATSVTQLGLSAALATYSSCRWNSSVVMSSTTPGVLVQIAPADILGQGSGMLPLSRTYLGGTSYSMTAPATVPLPGGGSACFVQWKLGANTFEAARTLNRVAGLHDTTLEPMYALPPAIVAQPQNTSACVGSEVILEVRAADMGFLSYQWRRNGVPITAQEPTRRFGGMFTSRLRIVNAQAIDSDTYDVVVSTPCGSVTSLSATLTIPSDCANLCDTIDFNRDGIFPDANDLDTFIVVLAGGRCQDSMGGGSSCGDLDFNNDGLSPDSLDLDALVSRLAGGPCLR